MFEQQHGGPAFPGVSFQQLGEDEGHNPPIKVINPGMTLRDWFAGMVLQGIMSSQASVKAAHDLSEQRGIESDKMIARLAYQEADAMLKERTGFP